MAISCGLPLAQAQPSLSDLVIENGQLKLDIDAPAGELIMQSSSNLQSGNWTQLSRLIGNGSTQNFNDPYNPNAAAKFYRVSTVPAANQQHLTGTFATELDTAFSTEPNYGFLKNTFGFTFLRVEATIPPGNDLSFSTLNSRIYSALIATLSILAENVSGSFDPPPSAEDIAAAIAIDLSDGILDSKNGGAVIQIPNSSLFLPAYNEQDFQVALTQVKAEIPGLYNVNFTSSGAAAGATAEAAVLPGQEPVTQAAAGSFTPSTPAVWGNFYWGSSEWQ